VNWLKQLFSRRHLYEDLSNEMRQHVEEKIDDLVATGMSRKEATAAARRAFGRFHPADSHCADCQFLAGAPRLSGRSDGGLELRMTVSNKRWRKSQA
jgi:uncharacterized protein YoaH (UPF0181 family)